MTDSPIIEVRQVTKIYRRFTGIRGFFLKNRLRENLPTTHLALDNISFSVFKGESFGIIGANGSGKSTLLRLLAGITVPTAGEVIVRGRVVPLLELGAGFHPLLTGRENIFLNAQILGMNRSQTEAVFDQIVAFSGLEECIDNPVVTYSSGMYVRLGFAVAVHANPDIFIVDEVLAVGDEEFQRKCARRIGELKEQRKTIIFVSHDLGMVNNLCDRVILLAHGKMVTRRTPRETIEYYLRQIGHSKGIHTCCKDKIETVFNHGRLAIFADGRELTAPDGATVSVRAMEQEHSSTGTEWHVTAKSDAACVAEGAMFRLPIVQKWQLKIEGGRLVWRILFECSQDVVVQTIKAVIHLRSFYERWIYGDHEGLFPKISPEDSTWSTVVSPEESSDETAALPVENEGLPALRFQLQTNQPYWHVLWCNSDYAAGSRVLVSQVRFPESQFSLTKGEHEIMTVVIQPEGDISLLRSSLRQRWYRGGFDLGRFRARFQRGSLRLFSREQELTKEAGAYFTMLIQGLWHDSPQLKWDITCQSENSIEATGESRRFPLKLVWTMSLVPDGLHCKIRAQVSRPLEIDEVNFSICLRPEYGNWNTDFETGVFGDFHTDSTQWRHLNQVYEPGSFIRAFSEGYPTVTLRVHALEGMRYCMTALNTDYRLQARVIQAFCASTISKIRLEVGEHILFEGVISVG